MLTNPRNAGLRAYKGEVVGEGLWAPLVDRDVFDGVVAILADPARISGTSRARKYLLSSLARCGKCNTLVTAHSAPRGRVVYSCNEPGCFGVVRDQTSVDRRVVGYVVERLSQPDAIELLSAVDTDTMTELRNRAKALRAKIKSAHRLWRNDVLTDQEFANDREELQAKLDAITAQLHDTHRVELFGVVIGAENVGEAFDALVLDRQRAIVDALVTVVIKPLSKKGRAAFDPASVETRRKL